MPEIIGATIGALAVVCIPLIAWFSRRASREGRLMLRVERLGALFAVMPNSSQRDTFEAHLTAAIARLNEWLDNDNLSRRRKIRAISITTYVVGVASVLVALPLAKGLSPWTSSILGGVVGVGIGAVQFASTYLVERAAQRKAEALAQAKEVEASLARMDALRRGEAPKQ